MTENRLPVPIGAAQPNDGASVGEMIRAMTMTTDIGSLVRTVAEAYRLTVSLERDIVEIKAYYANLENTNRQFHDQIMLTLEGRFAERAAQIALVREAASQLIVEKQFDLAHSIISQLMRILQQSPLEEALSMRSKG